MAGAAAPDAADPALPILPGERAPYPSCVSKN
jgi:hypothetical protein